MAELADGAALLVGSEYALAKASLVQALPDHRGHVLPPRGQRRWVVELPGGRRPDLVIDRYDKAQGFGVVLDDEDRPRRFVEALDDAVQIDERGLPLHGQPQAPRCRDDSDRCRDSDSGRNPPSMNPSSYGRSRCSTGGA